MSRRLDISSLLCDTDEVPATSTQQQQQQNGTPKYHQPLPSSSLSNTPSAAPPWLSPVHSPIDRFASPRYSPILSKSPRTNEQSPSLMGLDALVHAATEERRRLSGSSAGGGEERTPPANNNIPLSPLIQHRQEFRSPVLRHASSSTRYSPPRSATSFLPPPIQVPHQTHSPPVQPRNSSDNGPPPPKKQRRDSPQSLIGPASATMKLESRSTTPTAAMIMSAPAPARRPGSGEQFAKRQSQDAFRLHSHQQHPPPKKKSPTPPMPVPIEQQRKKKSAPPSSSSSSSSSSKRPHKPSTEAQAHHEAPPLPTTTTTTTTAHTAKESEDPHEWFLEHYAEALPSKQNSRASPAVVHSPPPQLPPPPPPPLVTPSRRTVTPEAAVAALEKELQLDIPHSPATEVDLDMEVDLAVTQLVEETIGPEDNQTAIDSDKMQVDDVEDELLSLVEDLPLKHSPPPPKSVASPTVAALPVVVKPVAPTPILAAPPPRERFFSPPASGLRPSSLRYASTPTIDNDRTSMPPPASKPAAPRKRKETGPKAPPKLKAPPKPRAKAAPKGKGKATSADATSASVSKSGSSKPSPAPPGRRSGPGAAASRSRSTSVMPPGHAAAEPAEEEEEEDEDKPYCVCKTKYDEDKVMIACDRCDEWYHTQCVNMPDLEVDLVDQFICPLCVKKEPHLDLKTTYKRRCLRGLSHPDPSSPKACHKPSRGAFSKYCSDECGVKHMQTKIDGFTKKGGKKEKLWELVKTAEPREGVVILADPPVPLPSKPNAKGTGPPTHLPVAVDVRLKRTKTEREVERLTTLLDEAVRMRENIRRGLDVAIWREKLLELAIERAETLGQCGWDQRLCFDDAEYAQLGAKALRTYGQRKTVEGEGGEDAMAVEEEEEEDHTEWWCLDSPGCERHADWQTLRTNDIAKEMEQRNEALSKLTLREREIRKKIEDIIDPQNSTRAPESKRPLKPNNTRIGGSANGSARTNANGGNHPDIISSNKKGKKRKAPAS